MYELVAKKTDGDIVQQLTTNMCKNGVMDNAFSIEICMSIWDQGITSQPVVFQKEFAVPEQFKTMFDGTKLVTTTSDIAA